MQIVVAKGTIEGIEVTVGIDSRFNGGSINSAEGEAIVMRIKKPSIISSCLAWCQGGGQAMQESA